MLSVVMFEPLTFSRLWLSCLEYPAALLGPSELENEGTAASTVSAGDVHVSRRLLVGTVVRDEEGLASRSVSGVSSNALTRFRREKSHSAMSKTMAVNDLGLLKTISSSSSYLRSILSTPLPLLLEGPAPANEGGSPSEAASSDEASRYEGRTALSSDEDARRAAVRVSGASSAAGGGR